ncbi:MAG: hypothetical protein JO289_01265 [Xanthobacteraceae bacterium]|nr:hypothetical protein [Xanthobacteraceae bacterium]
MISRTVPTGAAWAYEIKHDGFRFICRRDGEHVRLFSRALSWPPRAVVNAAQSRPYMRLHP